MADLTKLFVLVPKDTHEALVTIKNKSLTNKKIYFVEDLNKIVHNGIDYGVDPTTSKEIASLISAIGGTPGEDGTVTVDLSNLNYYKPEGTKTIIGAIKAIDAQLKTELDNLAAKIAASNTLNENYEFTGKLMYVAAKDGVAAHIALCDENGAKLSTVNISDIIGNGVLKTSAYDAATGILTLTFAQADGTEKAIEVDLKAMLDINDISIAENSKKYLEVTLGTAGAEGETQAVFGAKTVKVAEASDSKTGLADAFDVKTYVDSKETNLAVTAEGDNYVSATVNPDTDNKHVVVAANVKDIVATAGSVGVYNEEGTQTTAPVNPTITGTANSLVDGAKAAEAVKTYVDGAIAIEVKRADAKVLAAIKGLNKASETIDGTNVHITYKEEDGIVTIESLTADYATVNRTNTDSSAETPASNAAINVVEPSKLVIGSDLERVAAYAADKVTEEEHRVDKKIKDLAGDEIGADTGNYISVRVTSAHGEVSGVTVEFDPWETYTV